MYNYTKIEINVSTKEKLVTYMAHVGAKYGECLGAEARGMGESKTSLLTN